MMFSLGALRDDGAGRLPVPAVLTRTDGGLLRCAAMRDFSQLLDALVYTRSRTAKLKLIGDYLKRTPDPDRGYALAALTGELDLPAVKPAAIRAIVEERVDPVLLHMSRDYVGDMAETVSLLWPAPEGQPADLDDGTLRLSAVVERLASLGRAEAPGALATMLDHLDTSGRFALLKLATGALRIGISARLAKVALAEAFGLEVDAVEEVWHGIGPPYAAIFDWAEGRGAQPTAEDVPVFRPFMLAHPLEETKLSLVDYLAEWKWDGIRVHGSQRLDLARELAAKPLGREADRRPARRCAPPCSRRWGRSPCLRGADAVLRGAPRAGDRSRGGTAASGAPARRRPGLSRGRGIPAPGTSRISSTSTAGSMTIPSPSTQVTPSRSTPEGIKRVTYFLPSTTSVWPAFAPPAQRTTKRAVRSTGRRSCPCPRRPTALRRRLRRPCGHSFLLCASARLAVRLGAPADARSAPATASTSTAKPTAGLGRP